MSIKHKIKIKQQPEENTDEVKDETINYDYSGVDTDKLQ